MKYNIYLGSILASLLSILINACADHFYEKPLLQSEEGKLNITLRKEEFLTQSLDDFQLPLELQHNSLLEYYQKQAKKSIPSEKERMPFDL